MAACPYCSQTLQRLRLGSDAYAFVPCAGCGNLLRVQVGAQGLDVSPLARGADVRDECPPASVGSLVLGWLADPGRRPTYLGEIAARLRQGLPETDAALAELVATDPILTLNVLGSANGDVYGGLEPVTALPEAAERLGPEALRSEVVRSTSPSETEPVAPDIVHRIRLDAWRNALFTAHCARQIGALTSGPPPDVLYVAGLLHDVGRFGVCDALMQPHEPSTTNILRSEELLRETVERFHALCGAHMLHARNLPAVLTTTALFHDAPEDVRDENALYLLHAVNLAEAIGRATGYGPTPDSNRMLLAHPANRVLGLTNVQIAALRIDVIDAIAPIANALGVPPVAPIA